MTSPLVLITNDDGIAAPGLRWLARAAVEQGLDVVVAAPQHESSGTSAALTAVTADGRVVFEQTTLAGLEQVKAFSVAASPSYIVVLAWIGAFGRRPDIVLSGVNRGANAGQAVLHSGTVGAVLTAANNGARGMAASLDVLSAAMATAGSGGAAIAAINAVDDESRHWDTAATLVGRLLPWLVDAPPCTVLNVNVPDRPIAEVSGVRRATLAPFGQVQMAVAETGEGYIRTAIEDVANRRVPGTDVALLGEGYATVTPLHPPREAAEVTLPTEMVEAG